ncbi:MAG: hypothetical protein ACRC1T_18080 [Clostridium chrysemydis]|uniref:hypothetical protein n=1 Tax=Clostridium TaxID=1485 RepID=UPI0021530934|nr:hypothetical protein [Clostridium sp. LY3-2]MCR6513742.1 hypothetical protein [Clostridium sp. LY3-2]
MNRDTRYIDESIKLEGIYSECNEHLREQSSKRDQILAFYGAAMGFAIANLDNLKKIENISYVFVIISLSSLILAFVIKNYIFWHDVYVFSARTLQHIMFFDQGRITNNIIRKTYKNTLRKNFGIKNYFGKTEVKMLNIYLLISSLNIYLIFYFSDKLGGYFIVAVCLNIAYITWININTFKMIEKNFVAYDKESNHKENIFFPWCIDLYSKEKDIVENIDVFYSKTKN